MQCDACKRESPVVLRVVIAKDYNRSLARPLFNCPACYESKEHQKVRSGLRGQGSGETPRTPSPEPGTKGRGVAG